jgi:hypothetical protein
MITRIEAYRYRCFERLNIPIGSYAVLVGRNGAGKSTLVDIPVLIAEMLQKQSIHGAFFTPTPSHPRPRADGAQDLVFNRAGDWFGLAIEVELPAHVETKSAAKFARYELAFGVDGSALSLSEESLILFDERPDESDLPSALWCNSAYPLVSRIRPVLSRDRGGRVSLYREQRLRGPKPEPAVFDTPALAPALSFVPPDEERYPAAVWLRNFLSRGTVLYQPSLAALRTAQPSPGREFNIAPDASTLAWSVLRFAESNPEGFKEWNEHVASALPYFDKVEARQREDDGFAYLRATYRNGITVAGHGLSDGTLFVLAYTILPYLENVPAFVAIEEPENGIHPKAIEAVLEMFTVMEKSQVWVTSHSPIVVAVTDLPNLFCLSYTENGAVQIQRGDQHDLLAHWKGMPDLGTLHSAGVL